MENGARGPCVFPLMQPMHTASARSVVIIISAPSALATCSFSWTVTKAAPVAFQNLSSRLTDCGEGGKKGGTGCSMRHHLLWASTVGGTDLGAQSVLRVTEPLTSPGPGGDNPACSSVYEPYTWVTQVTVFETSFSLRSLCHTRHSQVARSLPDSRRTVLKSRLLRKEVWLPEREKGRHTASGLCSQQLAQPWAGYPNVFTVGVIMRAPCSLAHQGMRCLAHGGHTLRSSRLLMMSVFAYSTSADQNIPDKTASLLSMHRLSSGG